MKDPRLHLLSGRWWTVFFWLLISVALLLLLHLYWKASFPYTHDGENHLARFANYAAAFRQGQVPPRFAPHLMSGFGFPVFLYNYPLANMLAVPFLFLGINPEWVFKLLATVALFLGSLAVWFAPPPRFSRMAKTTAVLTFLSSSYLANLIFFRGNIGELLAYALVPISFAIQQRLLAHPSRKWYFASVGTTAALLLSHNLLGLVGFGLLVMGMLFIAYGKRFSVWKLLETWVLGLLASLWFWLPALAELHLVVLQEDALANQATDHLLTLSQALFSSLRFGFSEPGPLDTLGFGVGAFSIFVYLLVIAIGIRGFRRIKKEGFLLAFFLVAGLVSFLFTLEFTRSLWQVFKPLQIFQFPWRLLWVTSLAVIPLAAWVYERASLWVRVLLIFFLVTQFAQVIRLQPADFFHRETAYYLQFPFSTLTRNENRPKTLTKEIFSDWQPGPHILEGEGEVLEVSRWNGTTHKAQIRAKSDLLVQESTVYFSGWSITADKQKLEPVFTPATEGLIAYRLTAREEPYNVTTSFSERTWARTLGDALFVVATMVTGVRLWTWQRAETKRQN